MTDPDLLGRIISQARRALIDGKAPSFDAADLLALAGNPTLRAEFIDFCQNQINDRRFRELISECLVTVADDLDEAAANDDASVEGIDRAGLAVSAAASAAGIGMLVTIGVVVGPIMLLSGGLFGMGFSGLGRMILKKRANRYRKSSNRLRRFAESCKGAKT